MAIKRLANKSTKNHATKLTNRGERTFKFCLAHSLHSKYNFSKLKSSGNELDSLLKDCCGKTISQVEKLFLRTKGHGSKYYIEEIEGVEREVYHLGKDRKPFRVHGYYNEDAYFVICKIDTQHKYKY